jgi:hypothetical protein
MENSNNITSNNNLFLEHTSKLKKFKYCFEECIYYIFKSLVNIENKLSYIKFYFHLKPLSLSISIQIYLNLIRLSKTTKKT